jgi:hypothetical protein
VGEFSGRERDLAMITVIGLTAVALAASINDGEAAFLARVEKIALLDSTGKPFPRIERDASGNVEKLWLNGMQLSADDFATLGRLKTIRQLTLYRTNVTNADLRSLRALPHLEGLNLTSTEITDAGIDEIIKLESLRSLCLGNVAVAPEAVAKLKEHFRSQGRRLSLGYSQRR